MKFSYRDKVMLLTFTIILLLAIGIFVFINPMKSKIDKNITERNTAKDAADAVDDKTAQIPTLGNEILTAYDKAKGIADGFSSELEDYELNKYIAEKLDASSVFVNNELLVSEAQAANIIYYYYTPNVLDYSLKKYADLNGAYSIRDKKITAKSDHLSSLTPETIAVSRIAFDTFSSTREKFYNFLDDMSDETGKICVSAVTFLSQEEVKALIVENNENAMTMPGIADLIKDATLATVSMDIYSLEVIDKPKDIEKTAQ